MESNNKGHRKDDVIEGIIDGVDGLGDDLLDIELPESLSSPSDLVENELMNIDDDSLVDDSLESTDDLLSGILTNPSSFDEGMGADAEGANSSLADSGSESIDDLLNNDFLDDVGGDLSQLLNVDILDVNEKPGDSPVVSDATDAALDDTLLDDGLESIDAVLDETLLDDGLESIDAVLDETLLDDGLESIDAVLDEALLDDGLESIDAVLDEALLDDELDTTDAALDDTLLDEENSQTIDDLLNDESLDDSNDISHLFEPDLSDEETTGDSHDVSDDNEGLPGFMAESPEFVEDTEEDVIGSSDEILFEEVDDDMSLLDSFGKDDENEDKTQNIPHKEIDEVESLLDVISPEMTSKPTEKEPTPRIEEHNTINPDVVVENEVKPVIQAPVQAAVEKQAEVKERSIPLPETPKKGKSALKGVVRAILVATTLGAVGFGVWFGINQGYITLNANGASSSQILEFSSELDALKKSNKVLLKEFSVLNNKFDDSTKQNTSLKKSNDALVAGLAEHKTELSGLTSSVDAYRKDFDSKLERSMQATLQFMTSADKNTSEMGEKVYTQTLARVREEFADNSGVKLDEVYEQLKAYESKFSLLQGVVKGNSTLMSIYEGENEFVKRRLAEVSKQSSTRKANKTSIVSPRKKLVKGIPTQKKDDAFCCIYINGVNPQNGDKLKEPKPEYLILGVFDQSSNPNNPQWSIYLENTNDQSNQGDVDYAVGDVVVGYGRILKVASVKRGDGGIPYEIITELGVIRNR